MPYSNVTAESSTRSVNEPSSTDEPPVVDAVSVAISFTRSGGSFVVQVKPLSAPSVHPVARKTLESK